MNTGESEEGNVIDNTASKMKEKPDATIIDVVESPEAGTETETEADAGTEDLQPEVVVENIEAVEEEHLEEAEPKKEVLSKQTLVCIGEYPTKILVKGQFLGQKNVVQPIFIDKSSEEILKWGKDVLKAESVSGLDADVDTQFWFQVMPYIEQNEQFIENLKSKLIDTMYGVLLVSSAWDGIGSALLPTLISQFKEWGIPSVALALLPSKLQSPDASFNALSSVAKCFSKESSTLILVGRDQLNKYVSVERTGSVLKGNIAINCLVEIMLAKKTFVRELSELSRSFSVKTFTILAATGASFKIYGSLENILDTTLFRPLLSLDLSGASLLYVLPRIPLQLKEKLNRDKIELEIAHWFRDKATLKSIYVTDPLYVEDVNDRVDLIMFVGGFDLKPTFSSMEKKVNVVKAQLITQGSIQEKDWEGLKKSLA